MRNPFFRAAKGTHAMSRPASIIDLIDTGASTAEAIGAPGMRPLDYDGMRALARSTSTALRQAGIARRDRVAIVLPNGPAMASAFVSVATAATTAPLNPAYRPDEFEFYLSDLKADALIVAEDDETPAVAVARKLGIAVLNLTAPPDAPAGVFTLSGETVRPASADGPTGRDDIALILHTSGTTSRPKIVPLSHANVCASAFNIARTLSLSPRDRCLNVMPLFHIHGLIAALLATLSAGGSVHCAPGFNALRFFSWIETVEPTWYTAVPTMHQAILARADRNQDVIRRHRLRFIRSSSAPLPPQVMTALESVFDAPVIEAYGMTEAAHQMASNPLPPRPRKPGTVGLAAGPEVAIMDETGRLLDQGRTGEVVIRGDNVTPGYESNPEANRGAFTEGWFRTGDQGYLDADGYLTITGRLKEIINRGGEKVSPREVDEVLMDHPAVDLAVTFALPHDKLGEDVAAAVVLKEGARVDEAELRAFAGARLAAFKVPRTVVLLDEIPKGPTGKLQRIGLAEKLGLAGPGGAAAPR
jgi:acyl-CoA synthetase (AMP-forming)/AMP-acid ligase II